MQDIHNLISKFANSFDLKDWRGLGETLADGLIANYKDLRGTIGTLSREAFVQKRIEALNHIKTQHLLTNLEIKKLESSSDQDNNQNYWIRANGLIIRESHQSIFHTHAVYEFLIHRDPCFQIYSITQRILWNEGDSKIHAGVKVNQ